MSLKRVAFIPLFLVPALAAGAPHKTHFELTEAFLKDWAHNPVRDMNVTLDCAGPIHDPPNDCEVHIGAALDDPSISDFQNIVLEPPNVCAEHGKNWRTAINAFQGKDCVGHGFVRVWPEHLTSGSGCSNPNHFMEVHPLQTLTSGGQTVLDFTDKLRVVPSLGYKSVTIVRQMMKLHLWVCAGCDSAPIDSGINPLAFDYCFGDACTQQQASNFARFKVRVLRNTIRPETGKTLDGFATAIARVLPVGTNSQASGSQYDLLKLYAIQGSEFYDTLIAMRDASGSVKTLDLIGIFTVDPFSILKVIEKPDFAHDKWVEVPFPTALVAFGEH